MERIFTLCVSSSDVTFPKMFLVLDPIKETTHAQLGRAKTHSAKAARAVATRDLRESERGREERHRRGGEAEGVDEEEGVRFVSSLVFFKYEEVLEVGRGVLERR